jgi:NitT/TauT family transport system substrate-binding protein
VKKHTAFVAVWSAVAYVGLGALAASAADETSVSLPTLRVGHVGHDHQLALYVAALESAGRKEAWGIHLRELKPKEVYDLVEGDMPIARLRFVQTEGGSAMPAAMSRGEIDVGLGSTIAVAKFADGGQPMKIICPLQTDGDQFVMRRGSPITNWVSFAAAAKTGATPLRIGYKEPMAVAKMVFERALKAEDVAYGYDSRPGIGVVLVNFGSEKSPLPLLESGALDGFVMNQPGTAMAVHKGLAQVVAELRDLPPAGKWVNHPCCCVAATKTAINRHGTPIKALLKLIILSTQLIHENPHLAVDCAVRWTKNPQAVEAQSVPTVTYLAEPTDAWMNGMKTWLEMVKSVDFFKGKYAQMSADDFVQDLCALDMCRAAAQELRANGLIRNP